MALNFTKGENLSILIGGEEYNTNLSNARCTISDGDESFKTFAKVATGDTGEWRLTGTGFQEFGEDSFWTYAWLNSGAKVPFVLAPHGNTVPSVAQPHFKGEVTIARKPDFGGEAGEEWEFEIDWPVDGVPERITAPTP